MLNILLITTGGTIGCTSGSRTINLSENTLDILNLYRRTRGEQIKFDTISPFHILSENCQKSDWENLISTLSGANIADYDGVIITHGSDTLAYTAAAVGFAFADTPVPILLIAADRPLDDPRSNGLDNFSSAVDFIHSGLCRGVFVAYRDIDGTNNIHLAARIQSADRYTDRFTSVGGVPFAKIINNKPELYGKNPTPEHLNAPCRPIKTANLNANITVIHPYPSVDYRSFSTDADAVLHTTYHSGTVPQSCVDFIKRCSAPVYLCCLNDPNGVLYSSCRAVLDAGAIPLKKISEEAAYAKLVLAYSQTDIPPEEIMQQNICFEILP